MYTTKKLKVLSLLVVVMFLVAALFTGCKMTEPATETEEPQAEKETEEPVVELEPVNLSWYFPNGDQEDMETVQAAVNELATELVNATVDINIIGWGEYNDKMNVMISAGEVFDLCYTAHWTNYYGPMVSKNAFLPLDDLIQAYAPNYLEAMPPAALPAVMIGGKSYAFANLQVLGRSFSVIANKKYFDKYGVDPDSIEKLEDLTPLFEQIVAGDPGIRPIGIDHRGLFSDYWAVEGIEHIADNNPAGVYMNDPYKVVNIFETPEFAEHLSLMREWYQKGIIFSDAAVTTDLTNERDAGKIASLWGPCNPDTKASGKDYMGDGDINNVLDIQLSPRYLSTSGITATMTAVSTTSENPERAVMFYDLLYSDDDTRLINLINYGVEDVHYTKVADDVINQIDNSGYWLNCGWETGSLFNCFRLDASQPDWSIGEQMNADSVATGLLGFSFDPTSVESEIAQFQTVKDEYYAGLVTGSVDPDEVLPEFISKMKEAGVDTIIAEVQRQVDEWKAREGK